MRYEYVDHPEDGRFELVADGVSAGYAVYRSQGTTMVVDHLEVNQRFQGRGLGSVLASGLLERARATGRTVRPVCGFLREYLSRHPEYHDLAVGGD